MMPSTDDKRVSGDKERELESGSADAAAPPPPKPETKNDLHPAFYIA